MVDNWEINSFIDCYYMGNCIYICAENIPHSAYIIIIVYSIWMSWTCIKMFYQLFCRLLYHIMEILLSRALVLTSFVLYIIYNIYCDKYLHPWGTVRQGEDNKYLPNTTFYVILEIGH